MAASIIIVNENLVLGSEKNGKYEFLVKWMGLDYCDATWEVGIKEQPSYCSKKYSPCVGPGISVVGTRFECDYLSGFELAMVDNFVLQKFKWSSIVIDEGHQIKNFHSKLGTLLKQQATDFRLLLTGTPLHNTLAELFALLHFLDPSKFPDPQSAACDVTKTKIRGAPKFVTEKTIGGVVTCTTEAHSIGDAFKDNPFGNAEYQRGRNVLEGPQSELETFKVKTAIHFSLRDCLTEKGCPVNLNKNLFLSSFLVFKIEGYPLWLLEFSLKREGFKPSVDALAWFSGQEHLEEQHHD
eukprot:Gb_09576 [translate_table: standard]